MTRYIVVVTVVQDHVNEIYGAEVYSFGAFDTGYAFLLAHENAEMFQIPDCGIGPCENLGKKEWNAKSENDIVIARILRGSLETSLEKKVR